MSQTELAQAVGVTHSAIGQIERGLNKGLTYELFDNIAHVLGVEPADLFTFPWDVKDRTPWRHVARELIRLTRSEDINTVIKTLMGFVRADKAIEFVGQELLRRAVGHDT